MVPSREWLLAFAGSVALLTLAIPSQTQGGLFDCLAGPPADPCSPKPIVTARSTYGPRFTGQPAYATSPAGSYAAPSCGTCVAPSCSPYVAPSCGPCAAPSCNPCVVPSCSPCVVPSCNPCVAPSCSPCVVPSYNPCAAPSCGPCVAPSCGACVAPACTTCNMPVTRYRPATPYVRRVQRVPYASYRVAPLGRCATCPTATYGSYPTRGFPSCPTGACGGYAAGPAFSPTTVQGGCSSCAIGGSPGAMTVSPSVPAATSAPIPNATPQADPTKTFRSDTPAPTQSQKAPAKPDGPALESNQSEGKVEPSRPSQPIQGSSLKQGLGIGPRIAPFGTPPGFGRDDRTTSRPALSVTRIRTASWTRPIAPAPAAPASAPIDDRGWMPSRD